MRFLATATLVAVSLLGGCTLYFDGDDAGDDDVDPPCATDTAGVAEAKRLVNPATLACETFRVSSCDDTCGEPCPEIAQYIPPWGECASECLGLTEAACTTAPECRVTRRADIYYGENPGDDFLGCFPLGTAAKPTYTACDELDADECSNSPGCTSIYDAPYGVGCGNYLLPEQCPGAQFLSCVPESRTNPGSCLAEAACDEGPPVCPSGSTPGVAYGCYTGACIPARYCGAL